MKLDVVKPNDKSVFYFTKFFDSRLLKTMKVGFLLIMFCGFSLSSCKKEISDKQEDYIKPEEIVNWFKEYKQKMPDAPNPVYTAATKTYMNDLMIARVPLLTGEGEMFFAKKLNGTGLQVVFFRRVGSYDNLSKNFTGFYESINMTNYVYHKVDYIDGVKVGEFKSQSIKIKSNQNSGIKTFESDYNGSWLGALWYCISNYIFAVPKKQSDGGWKCYGPGGDGESQPQNPQAGDAGGGGLDENLLAIIFPPHPNQPSGILPSLPNWLPYSFTPGGGLQPGTGGSNNINEIIGQIKYKVPLSFSEEQYLTTNQTNANELLEIIQSDSENEALVISTRLVLSVLRNNSFNSEDILREYNLYHNQNYLESDPISDAILRYFVLKYATLKAENSNLPADQRKSDLKLLYLTFSDAIHTGLDLLGLIPIGGEVFDVINGFTYHLEGDKINAYLSYAAAIPIAGYAAAGVKAIKAGSVIIVVVGKKGFLVGSRVSQSAFRKACGAVGNQVGHHIIPFHEIVQSHPLMQMAFKAGFDPNNASINGKAIEAVRNSGNHSLYANRIFSTFERILTTKQPPGGWDPITAKKAVEEIISTIKHALDAQPGVHVDYLIF